MHEDDSNEETAEATPATWEEYFESYRAASQERREAGKEFRTASERLDRATRRMQALEDWAARENRVNPYTGASS